MSKTSFSSALKWAYVGNVGDRAISAVVTLVLAAVIGPHEFGLVSIALVYIGFVQMFLEQGLAAALIQRKDLKQEHCDAVFWVNLAMSVLFVALTFCIGGWWARINHAPELARVLSVLSICIPIEGLSIVQSALIRRDMGFRTLAIRSNSAIFVGGVVGIVLAIAGCGVWALVGMQVARDSSALILLWKLGSWRPRLEFSYSHLKELLGFSLRTFWGGLGTFADTQIGSILLGVLFGPVAVGLYRLAERLMGSIVSMATTSIQGVSLPEFSRLQDQPEELRERALSFIRLTSLVTMPALAGMAIVSGALMAALGPKWVPATNVLRILCLQAMIYTLSYFTGPLLTALSQPGIGAKLEWVRAIIGTTFLLITGLLVRTASPSWQLTGMALARAIPNVFFVTPIFFYIFMRFAHVSCRDVCTALLSPLCASLSIVLAVYVLQFTSVSNWTRPTSYVAVEMLVGAVTGLGVLTMLDKQFRGTALGLVTRARLEFRQ